MSSEQEPLLPSSYAQEEEADGSQAQTGPPPAWRVRVAEALEARITHKLVITLTVIDAACVLVDLAYTLLSSDCEPAGAPPPPEAPDWLEALALLSTAITTFFLVEIPLSLWSLGPTFYDPRGRVPHAALHLFDALIILTTFVLEVVLKGKERELAGLLITLRLWRLLKLAGGVAVGVGEIEEETVKELARVKGELEESRSALARALDENQDLRATVTELESRATTFV
ncbi:hypothetical protein F5148DRAFT_490564 [Russula earlei]|uniref:Uncharacterized protein n=1 Tax=Russula earlei TaxID=71964 RepID=A0ACC0UH99_9AGAM|nr:hypothetical protein F5148DRAFT_490564 [Russula earlei]